MREMKDSRINGIGKIPVTYMPSRIKYIADIYGRIGFRGYTQQDLVGEGEGPITLSPSNLKDMRMDFGKCSFLTWKKYYESPEIMIKKGDILFVKTGSSYGKNCYVSALPMECTINPQLVVFKNIKVNKKWLAYFLQTKHIENLSELAVVGGTIPTMSQERIGNFSIVVSPESEQQSIVAFLDAKCAEIDALSADIQSEIDTLEAYKRSVITEAVTKGLDKTVPMKDSGIQWIGKIPAHWHTYRIADLYEERNERGNDSLPLLSVSINSGVSDKELTNEEQERVFLRSEDKTKYKQVYPGDITYNLMRAWQGAFGAVRVHGMVSPAYAVGKPKANVQIDSRYIEAIIRSPMGIEEMNRYSYGIMDFRKRLYWPQFRTIRICLPELSEQKIIADYIDTITTEINDIIAQKQEQLSVLADYKKSVIYEYVTGKKEVPMA